MQEPSQGQATGIILGCTIAGVFALLFLIALFHWYMRRLYRSPHAHDDGHHLRPSRRQSMFSFQSSYAGGSDTSTDRSSSSSTSSSSTDTTSSTDSSV